MVLEQLDDYNAKLSDLQESLHQALNHIRDAEDMNRATAARQRDHEVQWTLELSMRLRHEQQTPHNVMPKGCSWYTTF